MKTIEIEKATGTLAECARDVAKEPLVVTNAGKPVAILLSLNNTDIETISLGANPKFLDLIERSRSRMAMEGGISSDEVRRRLGVERKS
jgi:hypothetical protein